MESNLTGYFIIGLTAWAVNLPLGYIRAGKPKFSPSWFFWIHASIPLLIYLRLSLHVSHFFIPVSIFLAVCGQIQGARFRMKRMTVEENDRLHQIPPTDFANPADVNDSEILVALLNMGGPKTNAHVKDFLYRIFMDPRIIRFPLSRFLQPVFAWILVNARWKAVAERYRQIGGGSPIYPSTEAQVQALQKELDRRGRNFHVTYSFNYSRPLPEDTIREAAQNHKKFILPLSLYPHYSEATTGSNMHYLKEAATKSSAEISFLKARPYYLHPRYIDAFVDRIHEALKKNEHLEEYYLLFSAHGLPLYFLKEGDPYPFQIAETVGQILAKLQRQENWSISYQSDVGPLQWIKPSTEKMLEALAERGIKKLLVVPVSFVTDHIETLHEINIEYREVAEKAGIADLRMARAIETHPGFIAALADAVEKSLPGTSAAPDARDKPHKPHEQGVSHG